MKEIKAIYKGKSSSSFSHGKVYTFTNEGVVDEAGYCYIEFLKEKGNTLIEKWNNWTFGMTPGTDYNFEELEKSTYEKVLDILDLEIGDKINISDSRMNPHTVLANGFVNSNGTTSNQYLSCLITKESTFEKLSTTKCIILDGEEIEVSLESFDALKKSLLKDKEITK